MAFLQELRDLVTFKKSGELSEAEFNQAKQVLFGEAEEAANKDDFDSPANAENRPIADGKRYRRRSVKDWIQRMQQDIKNQAAEVDDDPRKSKMLALTTQINAAFAPGDNSAGITEESIRAALDKYYEPDGYIDYADFPKGGNIMAGRFDVKSGQAAKVLDIWTNCGEYHFDFAKAEMFAYNNTLFMNLGWYKIIGKGTKNSYENSNKVIYVFNDDITKVVKLEAYWDKDPNDIDNGILALYKDEDFAGQIEKAGLKADGPGFKVATV